MLRAILDEYKEIAEDALQFCDCHGRCQDDPYCNCPPQPKCESCCHYLAALGFIEGWGMSRRDQRRARKAAKNLHMYKTCGKRPWLSYDDLAWKMNNSVRWRGDKDVTFYGGYYCHDHHLSHMGEFRAPSGFKSMSRLADRINR